MTDVVKEFAALLAAEDNAARRTALLKRAEMLAMNDVPDEKLDKPIGRTAADLLREEPVEPDWLIPGVMARGWMVKFAAREKTGKGTLIAHLLGCLERGKPTVFGEAKPPATSLIYTEEPAESIREKIERAGLEKAFIVYGWELAGLDWHAKVDRLVALADEHGHGVLFVDNVSRAAAVEDDVVVARARKSGAATRLVVELADALRRRRPV